jgi:peptidoglycan hydrolase CwlO-like protein
MKKVAIAVMAAFLMSATLPALAQMTKEEKDQCLLASKNCLNEVDSIQKRIKRLQGEIKKGKKVYTAEELKKLQDKLNEVKELLNEIEEGGSN